MHFFYLDESGDTGANLADAQQPIFVLGGVNLRDEGWNTTYAALAEVVSAYFEGEVPDGFELHGCELLSPLGEGPFAGHEIDRRLQLVRDLFDLIASRKHHVHYIAIDKGRLAQALQNAAGLPVHAATPYTLAYDYMITEIDLRVADGLGRSARGMLIIDKKDEHAESIEALTEQRRFGRPVGCRAKWIAEFSYPLDSRRNPMVQLSDLAIICIRRFFEVEGGYRQDWPEVVKRFYAECYQKLHRRTPMKSLAAHKGAANAALNGLLEAAVCRTGRNLAQRYGLGG
jgi:hypothetical protein